MKLLFGFLLIHLCFIAYANDLTADKQKPGIHLSVSEMDAWQSVLTKHGVITAFENIPLHNVSIGSLETGNVAKSDFLGRFSIDCAAKDIMIFTAAGFIEQKVRVKKFKQMYINLKYAFTENSFNDAVKNNHISEQTLENVLNGYHYKGQRDYRNFASIFDIIRNEFPILKVVGTEVHTTKTTSFNLSQQVLYVVNGIIVADISYINPTEVAKIEFIDDASSAEYGMRGGNGVLKITLIKK
jgi:hypothetical protein